MAKLKPIWVDQGHRTTAGDVSSVADCDHYIDRLSRDVTLILDKLREQHVQGAPKTINELMATGDLSPHIPRHLRQTLFYKRRGLIELHRRASYLLRRQA